MKWAVINDRCGNIGFVETFQKWEQVSLASGNKPTNVRMLMSYVLPSNKGHL